MQTLEEILRPLEGKSMEEIREVAPAIGLDALVLYRIVYGFARRPSFEHVRRIAVWAEGQSKKKPRRRK